MIKELVQEIRKINEENYNSIACQGITIKEFDIEEEYLLLDFNDKLEFKITYNDDKRFIKFEILKQDERFWSTKNIGDFIYKADNKILLFFFLLHKLRFSKR